MNWKSATGAIALSQALTFGGVLAGGVGTGIVIDQATGGSGTSATTRDPVTYYLCPGEEPAGTFHRGDRVLATGQDDTGEWIEVRSPIDLSARVWVAESVLVPDGDLKGLDEKDCELPAVDEGDTETAAPGETPADPGAAPADPGAAPGAAPGSSGGGGTSGGGTTGGGGGGAPAPPPDTTGPSITNVTVSRPTIYTLTAGGGACGSDSTSLVNATITDPSGIASQIARWTYPGASGTRNLPNGAVTVPYNTAPGLIFITVEATDGAGNKTTRTNVVGVQILGNCLI